MTFALYDAVDGVVPVWDETHLTVTVTGGVYSVLLGSVDPTGDPLRQEFFSRELWLGVKVEGDDEMTPRQQLSSAPYALGSARLVGEIVMWSGPVDVGGHPIVRGLPDGRWHVCDGTSGTPDLRDRFVVGAGNVYPLGATGGTAALQLTESQLPSHDHAITPASTGSSTVQHIHGASRDIPLVADFWIGGLVPTPLMYGTSFEHDVVTTEGTDEGGPLCSDGICDNTDHSHTIPSQTAAAGGGATIDARPPYYALTFIMYTGD